jgi:hypothetical protein
LNTLKESGATQNLRNVILRIPFLISQTNYLVFVVFFYFAEFDQDLTEYHANKMRRVQRKVDDLRKAMIGQLFSFLSLFLLNLYSRKQKVGREGNNIFRTNEITDYAKY